MLDSNSIFAAFEGVHEDDIISAGEMMGYLDSKSAKPVKLKRWSTLLIAAILALLLTACGYVGYRYYIKTHVPNTTLNYSILFGGEHFDVELPSTAMVVNCEQTEEDVANAKEIGIRCNWVPDGLKVDYTSTLFDLYYLEVGTLSEYLDELGMTREEAQSWYPFMGWSTPDDTSLLRVSVFDAAELYNVDFLLGMYGGEAKVVYQGTRDNYEALEIQVDYQSFYEDLYSDRPDILATVPEAEFVKDYLLLYEPTEHYMLFVGGSAPEFSFKVLEKIADNVELKVTSKAAQTSYEDMPYHILDLARG
jgi:hypothetical protein